MAYVSGLDACRVDLYTAEKELREKYPDAIADKVIRVRYMHQWMIANPAFTDASFVTECVERYGVSKPSAYSDLAVLKALLPSISESTKEFHRWRFNEMILSTFAAAVKCEDVRTMERTAATYAKFNKVDENDINDIPIDMILPQPFIATDDPSVLGIKPIPNIREKQKKLLEKYLKETADIEDIEYEAVDLDEENLFKMKEKPDGEESLLQ